jgi:hypothetical protein
MPSTVIAERVGWERSIRVVRDRVAELRPLFVPPDPYQRTSYRPGELAQFDCGSRTHPFPLAMVTWPSCGWLWAFAAFPASWVRG